MRDFLHAQITLIPSFPPAIKMTALAKFLPFLHLKDAIFKTAN